MGAYGAATTPITSQTVAQPANRRVYRGKRIDLNFKDVDVHNVLRLLADIGGVNMVIPDDVQANVSVRLRNVPWDQAMEVILASKGLWYQQRGNLIRIARRETLDTEAESEKARRRAAMDQEVPQTEVFTLNYAQASAVRAQVDPLLSPKGRIEVDQRTNSVVVTDVDGNRRRIISLLSTLDTQTPQIQIEARIVEARTSWSRELGIQWGARTTLSQGTGNPTGLIFPSSIDVGGGATDGQAPTEGLGIGAANPNFAVSLPVGTGTGAGGAVGFTFGSVGGAFNLTLRLSAAEDTGTVRIVSAPKVVVLNNMQATISQGVSIPISVVSASGANTQFVEAALSLSVTPSVSQRDCSIQLQVQVSKNEADFVNTGARGDPSILRKEANTSMLVADGETSVIGGVYTRNTGLAYQKVPFLAEIPILGWFFKNRRQNDERTEMLIFITPRITNKGALRCEARRQ